MKKKYSILIAVLFLACFWFGFNSNSKIKIKQKLTVEKNLIQEIKQSKKDFTPNYKKLDTLKKDLLNLKLINSRSTEYTDDENTYKLKTKKYKFKSYEISFKENTLIKNKNIWIESQTKTSIIIKNNNTLIDELTLIGDLVEVNIDNHDNLYLNIDDVWELGNRIIKYNLTNKTLIYNNLIERIYPEKNYWLIFIKDKTNILSFKTGKELTINHKVNFVFEYNDLIISINNKLISYDPSLNVKWKNEFNHKIINKIAKSSKQTLVVYDESNVIYLINLNSGEFIKKELISNEFYVIDLIYMSSIKTLFYIEKNDRLNLRYLVIVAKNKRIKKLNKTLNKISILEKENTILLKNVNNETEYFKYNIDNPTDR